MRRTISALVTVAAAVALLGVARPADAHECPHGNSGASDPQHPDCRPTQVVPNWRGNYVPLFGVNDVRCDTRERECRERRREQQRWRDEWGCTSQWCFWLEINASRRSDLQPNSVHGGTAADHSMFELAHDSEGHGLDEGNHDTHGGSVFFDVCVTSDAGTSYQGKPGWCRDYRDTQVGFNVVDHDPCGVVQDPGDNPIPCMDEYHVIRPLDTGYTQEQLRQDQAERERALRNRHEWICGYDRKDGRTDAAAEPVPKSGFCGAFPKG